MKQIARYLDEAIDNGIAKNSAELARLLGVSRSALSEWRAERSSPNDDQAVKLAELLRKDPGELLAECGAARAKNPATRMAWERIAARMAGATMVGLLTITALPDQAHANGVNYRQSVGSNFQKFDKPGEEARSSIFTGEVPSLSIFRRH